MNEVVHAHLSIDKLCDDFARQLLDINDISKLLK